MTVYIALLRGINVGGKNRIKMAELKQMFESIGLTDVKTYIQSGNVLFRSAETEESLSDRIETAIKEVFDISTKIILRTSNELEQILRNIPFSKEEISEAEKVSNVESLYVACLKQIPSQEKSISLKGYQSESDQFRLIGREVYLLFQHSIRNSKLADHLHKLEVPLTVRNWKTLNKLSELAKAMDSNET
jgi:Uncharacterized protein conserved in bacteria